MQIPCRVAQSLDAACTGLAKSMRWEICCNAKNLHASCKKEVRCKEESAADEPSGTGDVNVKQARPDHSTFKEIMKNASDPALGAVDQAAIADGIAAALIAVVSDASAPESALGALRKTREDSVPPEQQAAVAALQAYGVDCAADVLVAGLEPDAKGRAATLVKSLEDECAHDTLSLLRSNEDAGAQFKSRLALRIATRCAELIAAEIDRDKQGRFTILDEKDAALFEARRKEHHEQRAEAAEKFLASLPERYPSFGAGLFASIRREVQRQIEERHKRPDTHAAVAALFDAALARMPESMRDAVGRNGN